MGETPIPLTAVIAIIAAMVGAAVRELVQAIRPKRNGALHGTQAGQKSPEYWELTFARLIKQCLLDHERINQAALTRSEILAGQTDIKRQIATVLAAIHELDKG